ncbi:Threonyl/alanyl tRNA synthetase [Zychaea mexicana]|uniref:Threonyl/alanyl tRNA synthetase n=1 Tax=Zychaea mexicana TaxID=64656 RepID=UPI0022FE53D0|nr:Threonyl/alanyl tRNA synthetase [Zychaea mexicana]KAI9494260.1 Threonyl/alanyl tRNA synthetase [Zychaea mexicana]
MSPITATTTQVPVGEIHCQQNPYSRELQTTCIECSEKPDKKGFYQVKLHDTVLFPEGGGQPFDTGFIDDIQVYNVQRKKLEHIHYTKQPVPVGKQVLVKLDWERRWDHMQQHSGQHLLTAVLEQAPYSVDTGSWNLGATKCFIELQTGEAKKQRMPTPEELVIVEIRVNQLILDAVPVIVHTESFDESSKPESLPDDYVGGGTIRRVEIQNLDLNPCCGTHVAHTGHLQSIKLLHTEKARGGNTRLFFLVGQRVTDTLGTSLNVSRQLNNLLSVPQEAFVENVARLQQARSANQKTVKRLMGELAGYVAAEIGRRINKEDTDVVMLYREDADMEFLQTIQLAIRDQNILLGGGGGDGASNSNKVVVLAAGEKHLGGPMMIAASNDGALQQVAKTVTAALDIKGGGKGRWQGKAKNWKGIDELQKQLDQLKINA